MELRHLRYFLAIAETLSFTRAAAKLRITQPALSHQIKQLEQEIGTPLFDRSGARLRLTAEGEVMKSCAEQAFRVIDSGLAAVSELNSLERGELKVAVFHAFGHSLLPPLLGRFMETYPGIRVRVRQESRADMERELIAGAIDFAIGYAPATSSQIVEEKLFTESFALAVGARHPWFRRKRLDVSALQSEPVVLLTQDHPSRALIGGWLQSRGIAPRVVAEMNSNEAVLAMVRNSGLATLLPERVVSDVPDVRTMRIDDGALTRTAAIFWHRHGYRSAAARVLSDLVKSAYATGPQRRSAREG